MYNNDLAGEAKHMLVFNTGVFTLVSVSLYSYNERHRCLWRFLKLYLNGDHLGYRASCLSRHNTVSNTLSIHYVSPQWRLWLFCHWWLMATPRRYHFTREELCTPQW